MNKQLNGLGWEGIVNTFLPKKYLCFKLFQIQGFGVRYGGGIVNTSLSNKYTCFKLFQIQELWGASWWWDC